MSTPLQNQVEQALAELREARDAMARTQRDLATAQHSASSKGRALTVHVDGHGEVIDIVFHSAAYRTMAPAELATLLVDAIGQARQEASRAAVAALSPLLPGGFPLEEMISGEPDLDAMVEEAVRAASQPFPGEPGFRPARPAGTQDRR